LEGSRFYFADAAAMSAYGDVLDSTGALVGVAEEHSKRVNSALRGIVARYCDLRHILVVGSAAKADLEPERSSQLRGFDGR
jgi:hypothetical protein